MLLITKVEIGSDFEAWAESCISFLDNAPSWVRYPKEMGRLAGKCLNRQKNSFFYNSFSGNNLLSVIFLYIIWLLFTEQDFNIKTNVFLEKQQYFPFS